jgi:hypothetical protein
MCISVGPVVPSSVFGSRGCKVVVADDGLRLRLRSRLGWTMLGWTDARVGIFTYPIICLLPCAAVWTRARDGDEDKTLELF